MDDVDQDCFVISFEPEKQTDLRQGHWTPRPEVDLPYGPSIRREVYCRLWDTIFTRVQKILRHRHASLADEISTFILNAHTADGLVPASSEIPTALISGGNSSSYTIVFQELFKNLSRGSNSEVYISNLSGRDCTNITGALRSLIHGFMSGAGGPQGTKAKASGRTLLPPHDLRLLSAWYSAVAHRHGISPKLVAVLHDVESVPPNVLEDLFYICGLHAPRIPLVFVLGITTSPDYLGMALSRSALTPLGTVNFHMSGGQTQFEEIVEGVFFDLNFEPEIMISLHAFQALQDSYTHSNSIDGLLSTLQLLLMEHCFDPLAACLKQPSDDDTSNSIPSEQAGAFFRHLRLTCAKDLSLFQPENPAIKQQLLDGLASKEQLNLGYYVEQLRQIFQDHSLKFRAAFGLLRRLHAFLTPFARGDETNTFSEFCRTILEASTTDKWIKSLTRKIGRLTLTQLQEVLQQAHHYFQGDDVPDIVRTEERFCFKVILLINETMAEAEDTQTAANQSELSHTSNRTGPLHQEDPRALTNDQLASNKHSTTVADAFGEYFRTRLRPFETLPLHAAWYMKSPSSSVTELINPSILSTTTSALMRPHDYLECRCCERQSNELATLPDESVAFLRYLEGGKMLNAYDWFDTFISGLGGERRRGNEESPTKEKRTPRKSRQAAPYQADGGGDQREEGERGEAWRNEVQARFLRCFHEFDMMGLLKSTGRKPDHVIRTVYDIVE